MEHRLGKAYRWLMRQEWTFIILLSLGLILMSIALVELGGLVFSRALP